MCQNRFPLGEVTAIPDPLLDMGKERRERKGQRWTPSNNPGYGPALYVQ